MVSCDQSQSNVTNLRQQVFKLLDQNPLLTAKSLAKQLDLSKEQTKYYQGYLRKLKYDWKHDHKKQLGSIRSVPDDLHRAFFVGKLNLSIDRLDGVGGWSRTRSKNHFRLFRNQLGRIRFFGTGTVELYVRKPANLGKAMQLFCDGFTKNRVVTDILVIEAFQKSLRIRGFHAVFNTDERLPYLKIPLFKGSNGIEVILGDRTHPNSAELIVNYMDQVEQARNLIEELSKAFGLMNSNKENLGIGSIKNDYSR
jgi:hypothetical protein